MEISKPNQENLNKWSGIFHYLSSSIICTAGLGNIWRLPNFSYSNGGAIFIIMHIIATFIIGVPLYYMEIALGQFSSKTNTEVYKSLAPGLSGIAWCQAATAFTIATFYSTFSAYTLHYFVKCLAVTPPWTECPKMLNSTCVSFQDWNSSFDGKPYRFSEEIYFNEQVLKLSYTTGCWAANPQLVLCLFVTFIIICSLLWNGSKINSRVSYVMASVPYILMLIVTSRMSYFPGSSEGTRHLFAKNWFYLVTFKGWYEAITQCIFSLSLGLGTVTTLAGHNKFYYQSKSWCIFIIIFQFATSILFGMTNYGIVGHMENKINTSLAYISNYAPWIIFVAYPSVLGSLRTNVSNLHLALFYLAMFIFELGSILGMLMVVTNHLKITFPILRNWHAAVIVTSLSFFLAVANVTPKGFRVLEVVNEYTNVMAVLVLLILSILIIHYYYGLQDFCWDVEYMSQNEIHFYWRSCWSIFAPVLITFALIYNVNNTSYSTSSTTYHLFALFLLLCLLTPLPASICLNNVSKGSNVKITASISSTNANWKPHDDEKCAEWKELKSIIKRKRDMKTENCFVKFIKTLWRMYE